MKVFGLTTGADTAGINIAIKRAFDRHAGPDWQVDSMVASNNYIDYPTDLAHGIELLQERYDAADVIHLHNTMHGHDWYDDGQRKPTVLHHHGRPNLAEAVRVARRKGALQVGSTYDLSVIEPELEWLPTPVDLVAMRAIREREFGGGNRRLRIAHAPTNMDIKGTDEFLLAFRSPVLSELAEPVLIYRQRWDVCLRIKASCDILFDQPILGYGSNAVEAWAMGLAVVSGVADPAIRGAMLAKWGALPFLDVGRHPIHDALLAMVVSPDLREQYRELGTRHVERWHDERVTVERLQELYRAAGPTTPGGNRKRMRVVTARDRLRLQNRAIRKANKVAARG